jgi:transcriptional regulator with XRE-family HTH domain
MQFHAETIGQDLQDLRKKLKYTQKRLADMSGLSRLSVIKIESGVTKPFHTIGKIISILANTPEYKVMFNEQIEVVLHKV